VRAVNADGTLTYSCHRSVARTYPFYYVRLIGGDPVPHRHADHGTTCGRPLPARALSMTPSRRRGPLIEES